MYDAFELPSLEQIEQMERQRSQALEALEINDDNNSVKCQRCGNAVPIVGKLTKVSHDRIDMLKVRINWMESRPYHYRGKEDDIKAYKQELAELLEEDAKYDKLRSLPLYSCRITGFKFVCSKCYDKVYMLVQRS
jgi:hypothetical protein